jgi:hypothetical protein
MLSTYNYAFMIHVRMYVSLYKKAMFCIFVYIDNVCMNVYENNVYAFACFYVLKCIYCINLR